MTAPLPSSGPASDVGTSPPSNVVEVASFAQASVMTVGVPAVMPETDRTCPAVGAAVGQTYSRSAVCAPARKAV